MIIKQEISLEDFEFWNGAVYTANELTHDEFETLENHFETEQRLNPEIDNCMDETELNDLFAFEDDYIAEILGYKSWNDLILKHSLKGGL